MNILMIPSWYQTKKWLSGGSFFTEQADSLIKLGHVVYILYCDCFSINDLKNYFSYSEEEFIKKDNGLTIIRMKKMCPFKNKINGHAREFADAIESLYKKYIANKVKIDIVHAQGAIWGGAAAYRLKCKFNLPYVITEHASFYETQGENVKRNIKVLKQIFDCAELRIAVSSVLNDTLKRYQLSCDIIIGNMVDENLFHINSFCKPKSNFEFVTVSHLLSEERIRGKGLDVLIQCFSALSKKYRNIILKIGGGGPALNILKKYIEQYSLDNVELMGSLDRVQVADLLAEADAFVLPSLYETFGVVYIEALASGCPIIATNRTGLTEYVDDSNGFIVEAGNEIELLNSMRMLIENNEKYDKYKIREKCINEFSEYSIGKKIESAYLKCISIS